MTLSPAPDTQIHRFRLPAKGGTAARLSLDIEGPARPDDLLDAPDLEARFDADGYMPYWADLWPAARMLAEAMADLGLPESWTADDGLDGEGKPRVLEAGCGLGLAGLAAAGLGARVLMTDYEPATLDFARRNAARNGLADRITVERLDFRQPPARRYAGLLGADVLYEQRLRPVVIAFVRAALATGGEAWIADPDRRGVRDWMADAANTAGLAVTAVARPLPVIVPAGSPAPAGTVYRVRLAE